MKKKLLSLLLALCLVMALVPMTAFAEGTSVDNWDGTADTSWYTSAPDASEYHISTAEQLAGLAQLVNADPGTTNFAGKTFYLENDLDLSGHEWISIGTVLGGDYPEYSFCGVFDGQGHVISNLYSHESYIEGADESHNLLRNALFGSVYNGEVKNLGVADAEIWIDPKDNSSAGKGILVDWMGKSKITNCWTSGSIYSGTKIEKNIGGIVGVTVQGCTISGCYSTATLTGNFTNSEGYYTEPNPADWPFDTIGGIVGARFDGNLTVTDCWFDGKIVVNSLQAAVGGIVGYTDDQLGSGTVNNCMVTTTDMGVDKDGNTCWVAYALGGTVENCYWPNDTKYGPSPLAHGEGTAVTDFTSADVLAGLKNNAGAGVEWVAGIGHPTFVWDDNNIPADYTDVDAAIASAATLDSSLYTNYSAVEDSIHSVDRAKSKAQQTEVDAMAKAIEDAVSALRYKGADYTKVDEAIAKANALKKDNYKDFTAVEAAVKAVVRDKNITEQSEVDAMAKAIEDAIAALQYKGADYTKVDEAIAKANALNKDNYKDFSGVEAAVKAVVRDKSITEQSEVDAMAKAIEDAIAALEQKPSSGGGPSSGVFFPSYPVTIPGKTENGTVTVSTKNATSGSTVTITVKPDDGFKLDELTVIDKNGNELKLTDKGNGKYTFTMPASKVEINASFVKKVEISPFSDVSTSAYYYKAVKWAQKKGITGGIGNGLFGPNQPCTRAQIVTFLWRAAGSPVVNYAMNMSDVPEGSYYAEAVRWALSEGITTGTTENTFSPDSECTRAQAVAFLFRYAASEAVTLQELVSGFSDADSVPGYALPAMNWALAEEIVQGNGSKLMPNDSCTRAQIVTFLFRAYQGK